MPLCIYGPWLIIIYQINAKKKKKKNQVNASMHLWSLINHYLSKWNVNGCLKTLVYELFLETFYEK